MPWRSRDQGGHDRRDEGERLEDGCRAYSYALDIAERGVVRVSEAWRDRAALDAHLQAPHMARWREERDALGVHERDISVHTGTDGEPI